MEDLVQSHAGRRRVRKPMWTGPHRIPLKEQGVLGCLLLDPMKAHFLFGEAEGAASTDLPKRARPIRIVYA